MNLSREIEVHLPYLRRFARALCGSQKSGDAYVCCGHSRGARRRPGRSSPRICRPRLGFTICSWPPGHRSG
ncbi:MAG: hypothetical protein ACR65T_00015 [Methylocystis sp.]|uniref:hypothetical protein n=1 Tax=Methylocystis sp. TaxID=1911079 RepID=UPI003DA4511A